MLRAKKSGPIGNVKFLASTFGRNRRRSGKEGPLGKEQPANFFEYQRVGLSLAEPNRQAVAGLHLDTAPLERVLRKLIRIESARSRIHGQETSVARPATLNLHSI